MDITTSIVLKYEHGRPGGFVHDLGLFSDASFWVNKRKAGYYAHLPNILQQNVLEWCSKNLRRHWSIQYNELYIQYAEDAALFTLKWS